MTEGFVDNPGKSRFEWHEGGLMVWADYRIRNAVYVLPHVEAEPPLRGTGAAGRLMQAIVTAARAGRFTLEPRCAYATAWFRRHPGAHDVLAGH